MNVRRSTRKREVKPIRVAAPLVQRRKRTRQVERRVEANATRPIKSRRIVRSVAET